VSGVLVTVAGIQPVRSTLKDPHLRFACCECENAVQHRTCKHQLAVLMHVFPEHESRRAMLVFVGTRLGMKGGCQPDCPAPDSLRPLLNKLQQFRAADDMPLLALPDATREHVGVPSSSGVAYVQLTSTSSASCPPDQCSVAGVTRTVQTPQQQADALCREVNSLFQASLQLALSPQDPAQQVLLLRKLSAGMQRTGRTVKAEANTVPATVPSHVAPSGQTIKLAQDCREVNEKRKAKKLAGQRVVAALCRPDAGSQPGSAQQPQQQFEGCCVRSLCKEWQAATC
jgi:hypothetical protein